MVNFGTKKEIMPLNKNLVLIMIVKLDGPYSSTNTETTVKFE